MLTADAFANRFVEQEFFAWADAVAWQKSYARCGSLAFQMVNPLVC